MKKRFTEAQIAFALGQAASGIPIAETTRKMGVIVVTFYRWRKLYANLGISEIRRLRQLEIEATRRQWLMYSFVSGILYCVVQDGYALPLFCIYVCTGIYERFYYLNLVSLFPDTPHTRPLQSRNIVCSRDVKFFVNINTGFY